MHVHCKKEVYRLTFIHISFIFRKFRNEGHLITLGHWHYANSGNNKLPLLTDMEYPAWYISLKAISLISTKLRSFI